MEFKDIIAKIWLKAWQEELETNPVALEVLVQQCKLKQMGQKPILLVGYHNHCVEYAVRNGMKPYETRIVSTVNELRGTRYKEALCVYNYYKLREWPQIEMYFRYTETKIKHVDY